jgi:hypothetical protein
MDISGNSPKNNKCYDKLEVSIRSQDTQQTMNVVITFSSESFKIVMATLLSIFVPQGCNNQLCSMHDNFYNVTDYNKFVIAFNFFTLFYFIILYKIELDREQWMIRHFDYDKHYNEYNLHIFKNDYPIIFEQLIRYNNLYFYVYYYLRFIYIINFIVSAILVLHFYYLDYRTVTTLVTNVILCLTKVSKGYSLALRSKDENLAISYYNINYLAFNTIDSKLVKPLTDFGVVDKEIGTTD